MSERVGLAIPRIQSFAPIARNDARILILGSMPGRASLEAQQYYAHPQNSFWRIMAELLQTNHGAGYEERVELLKSARIAVWDVLHSCVREGSLDTSIEPDTQVANDFRAFFETHRQLTHVFFNGAKAQACFKQHVLKNLPGSSLSYLRLPSTSPANASSPYSQKLNTWRAILLPLKPENF
jgi:double-stranded uracil-DNA glycosylase